MMTLVVAVVLTGLIAFWGVAVRVVRTCSAPDNTM
jgi:hypothetical protein